MRAGRDASEPIVEIAPEARERILSLRAQDPEGDRLALWLAVTGIQGGEYTYEMTFRFLDEAAPEDAVRHQDGLPVIVPRSSVDKLRGACIQVDDPLRGGLAIENPNRPSGVGMMLPVVPKAGAGPAAGHAHEPRQSPAVGSHVSGELTGDVAERVAQALDRAINPSIAAHGGHAELAGVDGDTAYLRLSGGCQGCGLATVTLTQGIRVAITEAVPEIRRVVDVTDHASGTNPYFEPAKK